MLNYEGHGGSEGEQRGRGSQGRSRSTGGLQIRVVPRLAAIPGWSKGAAPARARCCKPSPGLLDVPWAQGKRVQVGSAERIRSLSGNNAHKLPAERERRLQAGKMLEMRGENVQLNFICTKGDVEGLLKVRVMLVVCYLCDVDRNDSMFPCCVD